MIKTQYTAEDLKILPLRAMVAFAARCARRVESIAQLPTGHPQREAHRVAVDNAIRLAEDIAKGVTCPTIAQIVQTLDATRGISGIGIGSGAQPRRQGQRLARQRLRVSRSTKEKAIATQNAGRTHPRP